MEVTASPDALEFYQAAGFVDIGVAQTAFGRAPRMLLTPPPSLAPPPDALTDAPRAGPRQPPPARTPAIS